jgi:hypothetical protein
MNIQPPARFKAWQCVGCGRIESQETCLGICQDRPVEVVSAWERSYRALQAEARRVLADTR